MRPGILRSEYMIISLEGVLIIDMIFEYLVSMVFINLFFTTEVLNHVF